MSSRQGLNDIILVFLGTTNTNHSTNVAKLFRTLGLSLVTLLSMFVFLYYIVVNEEKLYLNTISAHCVSKKMTALRSSSNDKVAASEKPLDPN